MSSEPVIALLVYGTPLLLLWTVYTLRRRARDRAALAVLAAVREAGPGIPSSLHPLINPNRCLGCRSCEEACPETDVLRIVRGKAQVVHPENCVGHGACREACPTDAITLVLGTETEGVEVPVLDPSFQTSVPGLFVAGELGGMGLIRNAVEQGRQAVESAQAFLAREGRGGGDALDLVIVGAGPAGFAASLAARQHDLRFATLEQEQVGGAVAHYPRRKLVLTAPVELPGVGRIALREITKEALLELWQKAEEQARLPIHRGEAVESVRRGDGLFQVKGSKAAYRARSVILAIGRRGSPRKLGVPGEELAKVVYRLADAEQYRGLAVLVVGGGDSAVEAAVSLSEQPGTRVALSHRRKDFGRAKPANREKLEAAAAAGALEIVRESQVSEIGAREVRLLTATGERRLANDAVIVCVGGTLPSEFLRAAGVETDTKYGTPIW
jgi:thioredoxin reductase (NADPH)